MQIQIDIDGTPCLQTLPDCALDITRVLQFQSPLGNPRILQQILNRLPPQKPIGISQELSEEDAIALGKIFPNHLFLVICSWMRKEPVLSMVRNLRPGCNLLVIDSIPCDVAKEIAEVLPPKCTLQFTVDKYSKSVLAAASALNPGTAFILTTLDKQEARIIAEKLNRNCILQFHPQVPEDVKEEARLHHRCKRVAPRYLQVKGENTGPISSIGIFKHSESSSFKPYVSKKIKPQSSKSEKENLEGLENSSSMQM
ncbi:hypothetical protein Lade_1311 [Legionella adelaidensis]|uniref:Uncharacterized protein n=1 Tax=Legionella adelaidensis TaxID=45056 RepID=A0A0W0R6I1_9GAMM|nr:hypothetical protein [Legionella adelaidensis]KTC66653.1 hypothetical protein Lade_1311 [Legionella adelaidensis]